MCTNENLNQTYNKTEDAIKQQVDFISTPNRILSALVESKQQKTAIGIKAPSFFNGVLVTGIEEIILDNDPIIILKKYDSNGYILERERLKLSEIESVCTFLSSFENPYLKELGNVSRFYLRTP